MQSLKGPSDKDFDQLFVQIGTLATDPEPQSTASTHSARVYEDITKSTTSTDSSSVKESHALGTTILNRLGVFGQTISTAFNKVQTYQFKDRFSCALESAQTTLKEAKTTLTEGLKKAYVSTISELPTSKDELKNSLRELSSRSGRRLDEVQENISNTLSSASEGVQTFKEWTKDKRQEFKSDLNKKLDQAGLKLFETKYEIQGSFKQAHLNLILRQGQLEGRLDNLSKAVTEKLDAAQEQLIEAKNTLKEKFDEIEFPKLPERPSSHRTAQRISEITTSIKRASSYFSNKEREELPSSFIIKKESFSLNAGEKFLYHQAFEELVKTTKELSTAKSDGKASVLTFANGHFTLKDKQNDKEAKKTVLEVTSLLKTCLNEGIFVKKDIEDLKQLKENLKIGDEAPLLGALISDKEATSLKQELTQVLNEISDKSSTFPTPYTDYIGILKEQAVDDNQQPIPIKKQELFAFLLQNNPASQQLREDFLKAGHWLGKWEKTQPGEENDSALLLTSHLRQTFDKSATTEEKELVLEFAKQLIERGLIENNALEEGSDLQRLIELASNDVDPSIQQRASLFLTENQTGDGLHLQARQIKLASELNYAISQEIGPAAYEKTTLSKQEQIRATELEKKDLTKIKQARLEPLATQLTLLAKGEMKSEKIKYFIQDFSSDLSSLNANLFKAIHPLELSNLAWNNPRKAPNISESTKLFNQTSNFIINQIIMDKTLDPTERAKMAETFLEIANYLVTEQVPRDYNSSIAILAAINQSALNAILTQDNKLSKRAKEIQKKLETLFTPQSAFSNLRHALQKNQQDGIPYIPYLGMTLTDLTFIQEGNADINSDGSLNLSKMQLLAAAHQSIEQAQQPLKEQTTLHFNLKDDILNASLPDEKAFWQRRVELRTKST